MFIDFDQRRKSTIHNHKKMKNSISYYIIEKGSDYLNSAYMLYNGLSVGYVEEILLYTAGGSDSKRSAPVI